MKRYPVISCVLLILSLFFYGCGGSGSTDSLTTGTTAQVSATVKDGEPLAVFSAYSSGTFTPAITSFTLDNNAVSGAVNPSPVTITNISVKYDALEYDSTQHLTSPVISTVYQISGISGRIDPNGTIDIDNMPIFDSFVGVQGIPAVTSLLDQGEQLRYSAKVTFDLNEDFSDTPLHVTVPVLLFLSK
ncbi:MAG: hypothetical protein EG822_03450 [Deltaproteobacteria bacterium]|nr:hypothetical protein [Deltaproteobacteria bacterium]TLN05134.1 MAG: hypothetical protein FDZ73_00410 [bacterium]